MKDLKYIEEYIKDRKYNTPRLAISLRVTLDEKNKYWSRFLMIDDEDDYTDFTQAEGDSLEEVIGKIAANNKKPKL